MCATPQSLLLSESVHVIELGPDWDKKEMPLSWLKADMLGKIALVPFVALTPTLLGQVAHNFSPSYNGPTIQENEAVVLGAPSIDNPEEATVTKKKEMNGL